MESLKSAVESTIQIVDTTERQMSQTTDWNIPQQEPCVPDFDPPSTYPNTLGNNCPNYCQFVYEGWASTELNTIYVNCIENPTNWSLTIQEHEGKQYLQFAVLHSPINYTDFPNGAGLCSRYLIFAPFSDTDGSFPCLEFWEFEQIGEGDQNGNKAILNLWMSDEYWDCYEPGLFNFRVTARMELPIWTS